MNSYDIHTQLKSKTKVPNSSGMFYVNANVPEELFLQVNKYCETNNITRSALVRALIIKYLNDLEDLNDLRGETNDNK